MAAHPPLATPEDLAQSMTSTWLSDSDEPQQLAALQVATDEALGYLRRRYVLPLVSWSRDLTDRVCAIAIYKLTNRVGREGGDDQIRVNYTDAIAYLRDVSERKLDPDVVDSRPASATFSRVRTEPRRGW